MGRGAGGKSGVFFRVKLLQSTSFFSSSSGTSVRGLTVPTFVGTNYLDFFVTSFMQVCT